MPLSTEPQQRLGRLLRFINSVGPSSCRCPLPEKPKTDLQLQLSRAVDQ